MTRQTVARTIAVVGGYLKGFTISERLTTAVLGVADAITRLWTTAQRHALSPLARRRLNVDVPINEPCPFPHAHHS
jgi:hypothetical protein